LYLLQVFAGSDNGKAISLFLFFEIAARPLKASSAWPQ